MRRLNVIALIVVLSIFSNAQKIVLTGSVYDANGAVIINASVIAVNEKGQKFESLTNDKGIYELNLPFNKYNHKCIAHV